MLSSPLAFFGLYILCNPISQLLGLASLYFEPLFCQTARGCRISPLFFSRVHTVPRHWNRVVIWPGIHLFLHFSLLPVVAEAVHSESKREANGKSSKDGSIVLLLHSQIAWQCCKKHRCLPEYSPPPTSSHSWSSTNRSATLPSCIFKHGRSGRDWRFRWQWGTEMRGGKWMKGSQVSVTRRKRVCKYKLEG